jgi:methyl-accepting chemotaxis protein
LAPSPVSAASRVADITQNIGQVNHNVSQVSEISAEGLNAANNLAEQAEHLENVLNA